MAAFVRGMREPAAATFMGFVVLFFALQVLTLLLYGTVRVASSARSDVRSGVIESHRLMPMSRGRRFSDISLARRFRH